MLSYEERLEVVLKSMKVGEIYQLNDQECYFKLQFILFDRCDQFYYGSGNIKNLQTAYKKYLVFANDTLALFQIEKNFFFKYQIDENYKMSSLYVYNSKNENEKYEQVHEYQQKQLTGHDINFDDYKSKSNEILFKIVNRI